MANDRMTLLLEGAEFTPFGRNFSGRADRFNKDPGRSFNVWLDEDTATKMLADGWTAVKRLTPREEDTDWPQGRPFLKVKVSFDHKPPRIVQITSRGGTAIDEDLVQLLDNVDVKVLDIMINSSTFEMNGTTYVSAYLDTMMITIEENYLEEKYADVLYGMGVPAGADTPPMY